VCCKSCGSKWCREFPSEVAIHFPFVKDLGEPHVMVFPLLSICLTCGFAEFKVPQPELDQLEGARG
jgi:hypothetical protein